MFRSPFLASIALVFVLFSSPSALAQSFSDVSKDNDGFDFFRSVEFIKSEGLANGYQDGTFKPNNLINRAEFLKILVETQFSRDTIDNCITNKISSNEKYIYFSDVPRDAWFAKYVCIAKSENIIKGYTDGTFRPGQNVSYGEALKMAVNTLVEYTKESTEGLWYYPFEEKLQQFSYISQIYLQKDPRSIIFIKDGKTDCQIYDCDFYINRGNMAQIIAAIKIGKAPENEKIVRYLKNSYKTDIYKITIGKVYSLLLPDRISGNPSEDGSLPGADPQTFTFYEADLCVSENGYYGKDENSVYFATKKLEGADSVSFQHLAFAVAKDKNNVYMMGEILPNADSATFKYLSSEKSCSDGYYFEDKNHKYNCGTGSRECTIE